MTSDRERTYQVDVMSRVEGEGSFYLRVGEDGTVREARLAIFEAPRFFEAFLQGRSLYEVPDIVARICGICPVAYQMSSARALENALGVTPAEPLRRLRRLLYCGEWIESHALHVFMLHAPDFLGYPSAIEMAADHREVVERGLRIKKTGNALIELLGGRAVHPVSPCVGGFTRVPTAKELATMREPLQRGLDEALEALRWSATLPIPDLDVDYVFVALDADEYPLEHGDAIAVSGRDPVAVDDWGDAFEERHVEHSNALQARLRDGSPYLCGPMARLFHHAERMHPVARQALTDTGLALPVRNPYASIVVRCAEVVHAYAEALDIVDAYERPERPYEPSEPRASIGCGATEAPRGLLWHRYEIAADGTIAEARIVPPTSQNQARIEQDLTELSGELMALDHEAATHRAEQLIRAYDPCISCATHFLDLRIETEGS